MIFPFKRPLTGGFSNIFHMFQSLIGYRDWPLDSPGDAFCNVFTKRAKRIRRTTRTTRSTRTARALRNCVGVYGGCAGIDMGNDDIN